MKTAVRQILKDLQEHFPKQMKEMYENNQLLLEDIVLKSKEMEKQQIIKSNRDGVDMVVNNDKFITGEQYYNEKYGE